MLTPTLTTAQKERYSRHLLLPGFGAEGQRRLLDARVLVIGAGGLGAPVSLYLAAAGVGCLGLVDHDRVDAGNLQRQVLFGTADVGRKKVAAAAERLRGLNPDVTVVEHDTWLTAANAEALISQYDLVVDGTDNFATRYLVNDVCVWTGRPNVYASIYRFDGQVSIFGAPGGPCYRCVFPEPPPPGAVPSCAEAGVLGVLPGVLGSLQAAEALKWLTGTGEPLVGRLLLADVGSGRFRTLSVDPDPDCAVCGQHPTITEPVDYDAFCASAATQESSPTPEPSPTGESMFFSPSVPEMTVRELHAKQAAADDFLLLDVRNPEELEIADLDGTLIPMGELTARMEELEPWREKDVVVMCRSGARSAQVVAYLRQQGFGKAVNLKGGILAWSREIDPSVATY
ncbi:MAG: molybdopterin-synthase adenylyltransferase MoeB [Rhodothermales bacterium]